MRAGRLNARIQFQKLTEVKNGSGGFNDEWNNSFKRWCDFMPKKGTEKYVDGKVENPIDVMVRTRYTDKITEDMRLVYRDSLFEIIDIIDVDNQRRELEINVKRYIDDNDKYDGQ